MTCENIALAIFILSQNYNCEDDHHRIGGCPEGLLDLRRLSLPIFSFAMLNVISPIATSISDPSDDFIHTAEFSNCLRSFCNFSSSGDQIHSRDFYFSFHRIYYNELPWLDLDILLQNCSVASRNPKQQVISLQLHSIFDDLNHGAVVVWFMD